MRTWKRRNRRRRTSLKELGPRRKVNLKVEVIDLSSSYVGDPHIGLPMTYISTPRGPI